MGESAHRVHNLPYKRAGPNGDVRQNLAQSSKGIYPQSVRAWPDKHPLLHRALGVSLCLLAIQPASALAQEWEEEEAWDEPTEQGSSSRRGSTRGGAVGRGPFGLGIILGDPTGFTGKVFLARQHGIQAHVGWGFGKENRFTFVLDYVFHFRDAIPPIAKAGWLSPTVGIGGVVGVTDKERGFFGVRVPVGLSFELRPAPVEIFLELAIGIGVLPSTRAIIDGGIGARYYF